jgi:N6-adenosine-specific RNA methylase IME4
MTASRPALEPAPRLPLDERQPNWPFGALQPYSYRVILADPPWSWRAFSDKGLARSPQRHYPCLPAEAIMALPVAELADPQGCLLALWATAPMLPQAMATMAAWRFGYVTQAVWVKTTARGSPAMGLGYVLRNAHELLLLGTRGTVAYGPGRSRLPSVILARRWRHSAKPEAQYHTLDTMAPAGRRCELFARQARDGWDPWGNEIAEAADA